MAFYNQWQANNIPNYSYTPQTFGAQPQRGPDWVMVPDISQVEQVTVQPNGKAWIMCQNDAVFALRSADQMGLTTTDYYRFEKISPTSQAPTGDYVTRAQMEEAIATAIRGLNNESVN